MRHVMRKGHSDMCGQRSSQIRLHICTGLSEATLFLYARMPFLGLDLESSQHETSLLILCPEGKVPPLNIMWSAFINSCYYSFTTTQIKMAILLTVSLQYWLRIFQVNIIVVSILCTFFTQTPHYPKT